MKKITLVAVAASALFACNNGGEDSNSEVTLINNMDSVSYAIGSSQAKGMLTQVPDMNVEAYFKGYKDVADSATLLIAEADGQTILQVFGQRLQQEQQAKQQQQAQQQQQQNETQFAGVKQAGIDFLEANKANPGVQVTASGLQYIVMKEGTGKKPDGPTANVEVHYHGTTPDGVVFDSSVERGETISFPLSGVIPGWTEGVQLMKEGAKYKFFIPQELAYGANAPQGGQGPIKPYMPLVFEVELIKIN